MGIDLSGVRLDKDLPCIEGQCFPVLSSVEVLHVLDAGDLLVQKMIVDLRSVMPACPLKGFRCE